MFGFAQGDSTGINQYYGIQNRNNYDHLSQELAKEYRAQDQRQLIANAIMSQSLKPRQGKMVGRLYQKAHIGEGLGQIGEALIGGWMQNDITKQRNAAEEANKASVAKTLSDYAEAIKPGPSTYKIHEYKPEVAGNLDEVLRKSSPKDAVAKSILGAEGLQMPTSAAMSQGNVGNVNRMTGVKPYTAGTFASDAAPEESSAPPPLVIPRSAVEGSVEEIPGAPPTKQQLMLAGMNLAKSSDPTVKAFGVNERARLHDEEVYRRDDIRNAEAVRQFNATLAASGKIQDDLVRFRKDEEERHARESYGKSVQARAKIEDEAADRASREKIAQENNEAHKFIAQARLDRPLPGMTVDPKTGEHIPVIGSKQWTEESKSIRLDSDTLKSSYEQAINANKKISQMLNPANVSAFNDIFGRASWLTGAIGGYTNPKTLDMKRNLDSLLSMASVMGLSDIRKISGGSAGTITEREWPRLEAMVTTLKESSSENGAREALKDIKDHLAFLLHQKYEDYTIRHTDSRHKDLSVPTFNEYERTKEQMSSSKGTASYAPTITVPRGPNGNLVMP